MKTASKKTNVIVNRLECKRLQFHVTALMIEPDIDDLELPAEWLKTGEDFQDELEEHEYAEELSAIAASVDPEWDEELDGIVFVDALFDLNQKFDAGQRLMKWINEPENRSSILSSIMVNTAN